MTRKELSRSAKAQEASEKALVQQANALALTAKLSGLSFLPVFILEAWSVDNQTAFLVKNLGKVPAFDLTIMTIAGYNDHDKPLGEFLRKNYPIRDKNLEKLKPDEKGFYYISDHVKAFVLPSQMELHGQLGFPEPPHFVSILLQFRDTQGNHYSQEYSFIADENRYRLYSIEPVTPNIFAKLTTDLKKPLLTGFGFALITEDGSDVPEHLMKDFVLCWNQSVPGSFFDAKFDLPGERFSLTPINPSPFAI